MQNLNVLCGATCRGTVLGLFAGAALAVSYAMVLVIMILISVPSVTESPEIIPMVIVAFPFLGVIAGALAGIPAGTFAGLLIGATGIIYLPHFKSTGRYRLLAGALAVLGVQALAMPPLNWVEATLLKPSGLGAVYSPSFSDIVWLVAIPTFLGCIGAAALSRLIAAWCINELNKGVIQNG